MGYSKTVTMTSRKGDRTVTSSQWRGGPTHKNVKNEGTSGDVHENKDSHDNLPGTKDDISARLHAILHRNARILQKPPAFFLLFERCGIKSSLSNIETRECRQLARHISGRKSGATPEMSKAKGRIPFAARRGVLVESAPSWRRAFAAEVGAGTHLPVCPVGVWSPSRLTADPALTFRRNMHGVPR